MNLFDKFAGKIAWVLTGICFAAACAMMYVSGTFHLDCFYDVGKIYDVPQDLLQMEATDAMRFDGELKRWTVTADLAKKSISAEEGRWRYLYLGLSDVNRDGFPVGIACFNQSGELVHYMDTALCEGGNLFHMPKMDYSSVDLIIENQIGLSFRLEQAQFRRKAPVFSKSRFLKGFALSFAGFFAATGALYAFLMRRKGLRSHGERKKMRGFSWYMAVDRLQDLFLYAGKAGEAFCQKYGQRTRGKIRSGIFCFLLLFMEAGFLADLYSNDDTYRYLLLVCAIGILLMAFSCWEKPLVKLNWNNKLVASWLAFCVLTMISDFIVLKRYTHTGYVLVFVFGFLFFMWGNMKDREELVGDLLRGIEWSFPPHLLFCYLFRPYLPGYRYSGTTVRPGYFSIYLLFVWIAFLAELDFKREKKTLAKDCVCIFMLGICADLLWKSQSVASLIPAVLALFIFSYKLWRRRKQMKLVGFALYLAVFGIGYIADGAGVYYIPRAVNAEIKFEKDFYPDTATDSPFTLVVQAAEEEEDGNRILEKLKSASLEQFTSGRTLYWKTYVRELNLWGHEKKARLLGGPRLAHNGFLLVMYRYGIFTVVPYTLMVVYSLLYAFRYTRRYFQKRKYALFVSVNMLICFLLLFVENAEDMAFFWVCWYSMYLMMGICFDGGTAGVPLCRSAKKK